MIDSVGKALSSNPLDLIAPTTNTKNPKDANSVSFETVLAGVHRGAKATGVEKSPSPPLTQKKHEKHEAKEPATSPHLHARGGATASKHHKASTRSNAPRTKKSEATAHESRTEPKEPAAAPESADHTLAAANEPTLEKPALETRAADVHAPAEEPSPTETEPDDATSHDVESDAEGVAAPSSDDVVLVESDETESPASKDSPKDPQVAPALPDAVLAATNAKVAVPEAAAAQTQPSTKSESKVPVEGAIDAPKVVPPAVERAAAEEPSRDAAISESSSGAEEPVANGDERKPEVATNSDRPQETNPTVESNRARVDATNDAAATQTLAAATLTAPAAQVAVATPIAREAQDLKGPTPKERAAAIDPTNEVGKTGAVEPSDSLNNEAASGSQGERAFDAALSTSSNPSSSNAASARSILDSAKVRIEQVSSSSPPSAHGSPGAAAGAIDPADAASRALGPSNATSATSIASPVPIHSILAQIQRGLRPGTSELRLRLDPPALGLLTLKFSMKGDSLAVTVRASRPEVVEALKSDLQNFKSTLKESGIDISRLEITLDSDKQSGDPNSFNPFKDAFDRADLDGSASGRTRPISHPSQKFDRSTAGSALLDVMA